MHKYTEQDLQYFGQSELIEIILEQQELLDRANNLMADTIKVLENVKERIE